MAEVRGKNRLSIAERGGKYTTISLKSNTGGPGIADSWPNKLSISAWKSICNLMTRCEDIAKGYIPSNEMQGLQIAQLLGEWPEIEGEALQPIWGSLSCG
jgi:hypothetical protein